MSKSKKVKNILIVLVILFAGLVVITKIYINTANKKDSNLELPSYVDNIMINDDFFSSMSGKEIVNYKILNSIDFFKNATGKYIYTDKTSNYTETVKYCADIEKRQSYVSIISDDGNVNTEITCKDNIKKEFNNIKKLYSEFQESGIVDDENIRKLKPKDRYLKNGEFINRNNGDFLYRNDKTLFNQEIQSYLRDYNKWEIYGEEDYLNRKSILISGKLGFTGKSGENNFKIIVDRETGIILKLDLLGKDSDIIMSMETKEINIDKNIDSSMFEKSINGYKKESN